MAQATFSIRMDEQLKQDFDALCAEFGMSASTAFNVFAKAVIREKKIPFEISSTPSAAAMEEGYKAFMALRAEAQQKGLQELSLDEINEEIRKTRISKEVTP